MECVSKKVQDLLKLRVQNEEYSSRLYKAMSNFLEYNGYTGAAKLWDKYSSEELTHAKWVNSFLLDLDYLPPLPAIKEPPCEFESLSDIIKKSFEHEYKITEECKELAKTCLSEGDFLTLGLAQRLINEQVEELAKTQLWVDKLESFGESKDALKLLDNEMSEHA